MATYEITKAEHGKKLAAFVRRALPGVPLSGVHKMIRVGKVRLNGRRGKQDDVLSEGDVVSIQISDEEHAQVRRKPTQVETPGDVQVIFEDADMLLVNKPAGLLTHPDQPGAQDSLAGRVLAYLRERGERHEGVFQPAPVNRLDRNTSGLVLFGKHAEAMRRLAEDVREHRLRKFYVTLVEGNVTQSGEVRKALARTGNRTTVVAKDGQEAITRYWPLGHREGYTLLELEIVSGRTHQIRAHMRSIGHPLLGDVKYGGRPAFGFHHQLLHAHRLRLADGRTFTAPLPVNMARLLGRLGLRWPPAYPPKPR